MPDLRARLQDVMGSGYRLERELGGGAMSRVFLAEETRFHRRVVVKLLSLELAAGVSTERFEREIALAAQLQQANIVPLIAAGDVDGLPWYTMPYVEGESLRTRLTRGPVPLSESVSILRDVARALAYAHGHAVVHRDIKPENILLSGAAAVVTDFGIAKAIHAAKTDSDTGTLTEIGTSLGTPAYMAPEQATGDHVDQRADVYAWGVVAYELLAGRHPFDGKSTAQQLIAAHITEVPRSLTATGSHVTGSLARLVMQCLAKDPAKRPASAKELLAELDDAGTEQRAAFTRGARLVTFVGVVAVIIAAFFAWSAYGKRVRTAEAAGPVMLAVLPFENAGPAEQAAFTDGLTDAVTAKLAALPSLGVIDRRSAAQYRQTAKTSRQIGSELGVPFLVEGVVRWAKDAGGAWRAQVTPTLIDARAGTTKWTGEPVLVTPSDPFTAQGSIATKVAEALQVALRPADLAGLARRVTSDPEAFAAYQRGRSIIESNGRTGTPRYDAERAAAEFRSAIARDSMYADAWAYLAYVDFLLAQASPGAVADEKRMRATMASALRLAPGHPRALLTLYSERLFIDRDTVGIDSLIRRALAGAPSDPAILRTASISLARRQRYDTAYALAVRAAQLDPRSISTISHTGVLARVLRRWVDARRYADAAIALDSSDERGWAMRLAIVGFQGDTIGMQHELELTLARLPHPSTWVLNQMAYASDAYARRYMSLTARELSIETLYDSINIYFDNKADAALRVRDMAKARAYYDSIRSLLAGRSARIADDPDFLVERALVEAVLGQPAIARATLAHALNRARVTAVRADLTDVLDALAVARVYVRLGEPSNAVHWLQAGLDNPVGGYTPGRYAIDPTLQLLRGTPAFDRMVH